MAGSVIDDTTASMLQANTAASVAASTQGFTYLMEATRLGHQAAINMRDAAAVQEMRMSAQAREVLQSQVGLAAPRGVVPPMDGGKA